MESGTQTLDPRRYLPELLAIIDAGLLTGAIFVWGAALHLFDTAEIIPLSNIALVAAALGMLTALVAFERGLYGFHRVRCCNKNVFALARVFAGVGAIFLFILAGLEQLTRSSATLIGVGVPLGFALVVGVRKLLEKMLFQLPGFQDVLTRRIAIIGAPEAARELAHLMGAKTKERALCKVVGIYSDGAETAKSYPRTHGTYDELIDYALHHRLDEIIVAQPLMSEIALKAITDRFAILPVPIKLCPTGTGYRLNHESADYASALGLTTIKHRPIDGLSGFLKDLGDKLAAGVLLVATLPLLALVALAIKLESPGPVFFRQRRHGFNHRVFRIWKFRTMKCMEDGDHIRQALDRKQDERITPLGDLLRRTSIDELPQLFNVVLGDMSIVGPRPHALAHNDYYSARISNYACRHVVKPGMTGLAQVEGCRGETRDLASMRRRVHFDLDYIENWSLWRDVQIILRTLGVLVVNTGTKSQDTRSASLRRLVDSVQRISGEQPYDTLFKRIDLQEKPLTLSFLNAHAFNLAWTDEKFRAALLSSDFLLRDGIGMKLADRLMRRKAGANMNGSDLIPALLKRFGKRRTAILGTEDPWLSIAVDKLRADGVNVVWSHHGFEPESFYLEEAKTRNVELIILAMGMPKQELLAATLVRSLRSPAIIVNGGFVIDFIAGRKPRAPALVRRLGLEWSFRLLLEPKRLFNRYVVGNPLFLARMWALHRTSKGQQGWVDADADTNEAQLTRREKPTAPLAIAAE